MSEKAPDYKIKKPQGITVEEIQAWPSARLFTDPNYEPPTPEQVKQLQLCAGWSQVELAKLVGVNFTERKGSPTVRRWLAPVGDNEHRDIPYSVWRLMLIEAGIVGRPTWERGGSQHWMDSEVAERKD